MDVDTLHAWVLEDFGLTLSFVEPVHHGADAGAALWRATTSDGEELAVKWTAGGSPSGLALPAELAARDVPGVLAPLATRDGALCSERDGRRLVLQPWLTAPRAISSTVLPAHWAALGALLGQVHGLPVDGALAEVPTEPHDPAALVRQVREGDARWRDGTTGLDDVARETVERWRAASDVVLALAAAASELAPRVQDDPSPRVLCHTDPHLGNVLLHGDRWVWLLDWDDAVLAYPEQDLMFVLDGGALAGQPVRAGERASFEAGYRAHHPRGVRPDPHRLAYYQCVRGLWDAVDWAERAVDVTGSPLPERVEALDIVRGILSSDGLVAAALRTVRSLDG